MNEKFISAIWIMVAIAFTSCQNRNADTTSSSATSSINQTTEASPNQTANTTASATPTQEQVTSTLNPAATAQKKMAPPSDWRTYTNTKFGFSFQYPLNWIKEDKDAEVVNLKGTITEVDINFNDPVSKTTLLVAYHLPPNGATLYKYAVSQFESKQGWRVSGAAKTEVAGSVAIEAKSIIKTDGRGYELNPAIRSIIVDFPDQKQTGEFQLQFKTPMPGDVESEKFNQLKASFRFTNP